MIDLTGQVAVITGGSRGIGAAAVELFAEAGANVVFSYHRAREAAEKVAKRARKHGVEAVAVQADLRKVAGGKKLIDAAIKKFKRLDVLVANAGIWNQQDIPIEKLTERQWDEMLETNLRSVYSVIRFAVPHMKKQTRQAKRENAPRPRDVFHDNARNRPRIIAISSTAGQRGEAFHAHYAASKGAIISMVKGLSTELAPHHILVNCVAPGWVATDMSKGTLRKPGSKKRVLEAIPVGRVGTPEEIAGPILFLASELATFMTGEIVNVNGGAVLAG